MNRYFARYYANTMFSWGSRIDHAKGILRSGNYNLPNQEIYAYELVTPINNGVAFFGLGFDGYVNADNHDDALVLMYNSVNLLLCLHAYVTLSPYSAVRIVCDYEASDNLNKRNFNHYSYPALLPEILKSIRVVDMESFVAVWNNGEHSVFTSSLNNALYQLNKSLQADVVTDEFLCLWNGIEYLAYTLNEKYNIKETLRYINCRKCGTEILKCTKCKHEFKEEVKSKGKFDGIRTVAQNKMSLSRIKFDKLHEARSILLHDGTFKSEWTSLIPIARVLLVLSIAEAIGIEDNVVQKILKLEPSKSNLATLGNKIIHRGKLTGLEKVPEIESVGTQPMLKFKDENIYPELSMNEVGSIQAKRDMKFEYVAPMGVVFNDIKSEVWLPTNSGIKNASLDLKKI